MFKLALDTYMVGLIEEARVIKPYYSPSMIVSAALEHYVKYLSDCDEPDLRGTQFADDLKGCGDLLELLCAECDDC